MPASTSGRTGSAASTDPIGSILPQMNSRISVASGSRSTVDRSAARKSPRFTAAVAAGPIRAAIPALVYPAAISAARSRPMPPSSSSASTHPFCGVAGRVVDATRAGQGTIGA